MSCNDGFWHQGSWKFVIHVFFSVCVSWSVPMLRRCTCPPTPPPWGFFFGYDRVMPIVGWWVVRYNLEGVCQEAAMAWSRYFPGICLEGLRKTTKTSMLRPRVESIVFRLQFEGVPATPARSVLPSHRLYYPISAVTVSVIVSCSATNMLGIVLYWPVFLWVTC
jgi:hypothetical protein